MIITLYVDTIEGGLESLCNGYTRPIVLPEGFERWRVDIDTVKLEACVRPASVEERSAFSPVSVDEIRRAGI